MDIALASILCGEEGWYFHLEDQSIKFNDGIGEVNA
jgi:hypothetical protein